MGLHQEQAHKGHSEVVGKQHSKGIFYFKNSHMICFYLQSKQQQIQLTYYKLAQLSEGDPFHQHIFEYFTLAEQSEYYSEKREIVKLNDTSMVGFMMGQFLLGKENYFLAYYNLDVQKQTGEFKKIQLNLDQSLNPQKLDFMKAKVSDIWEVSANRFYIQVYTSVDSYKYQESDAKLRFKNEFQRYHTLYYNYEINNISFGKVNIAEYHRLQFINVPRALKCMEREKQPLLQKISKIFSYPDMLAEPKIIGVPIYYIELDGSKILMNNHPLRDLWGQKFEWPNYATNKMHKIDQNCTQVTVYKFPEEWFMFSCGLRMLSVMWMNEFVEDCDDDLVEYVHNLL